MFVCRLAVNSSALQVSAQLFPSAAEIFLGCVCMWLADWSFFLSLLRPPIDTAQGGDGEGTGAAVLSRQKSCAEVMEGNWTQRSAPAHAGEIKEPDQLI